MYFVLHITHCAYCAILIAFVFGTTIFIFKLKKDSSVCKFAVDLGTSREL